MFYQRDLLRASAASASWDLNTANDYTYDNTKIEFSGGNARLKASGVPGADWIATDGGGNNWKHRKQLTITNNIASELTPGYSINLSFDHNVLVAAGKSLTSGNDLRVAYYNGASMVEIDCSLDESSSWNNASTKIWFKTQAVIAASLSDTNYYIYYGNSSAQAPTVNKSNIFALWDDFSDGNANGWTTASMGGTLSSAAVVSGQYRVNVVNDWYAFWNTSVGTMGDYEQIFKVTAESFGSGLNLLASGGRYQNAQGSYLIGSWNNTYSLYRRNSGTWTALKTYTAASTNSTGVQYYFKVQLIGFNLKIKLWQVGAAEPEAWSDTTVDSSSSWSIGYPGFDHYPGIANFDDFQVRKIVSTEPSAVTGGTENTLFPTTSPILVPNTGQAYVGVSAFSETLGAGSTGITKYQVSPDNGSTWYWWNGSAWVSTSAGYNESNTSADINTHFADGSFNSVGSVPKILKWRAFLNSDGSQQPKLDSISISYVWDTKTPDNPASLATSKSQRAGGSDITSNTYIKYPAAYFTWTEPSDYANPGEQVTGISGYYVYFGTSATADPHTTRGIATELGRTGIHYQADRDFEISVDSSAMVSGQTYYLRIETKDNADNIKHLDPSDPSLFIYKYDGVEPTSPIYATVSPSGYSRTNSFTFSWPITGPNMGNDTGGSGLTGYQYKVNSGEWSETTNSGLAALDDAASTGINVFYLRSVDGAGNTDSSPVQTNFYFNNAAPTAPTSLIVDPDNAPSNAFSFSWGLPLTYNGSVAGYYYSINALPTPANVTYTTNASLPEGPYATQQGENTFYIVAKDEAGNYDLASCNSIQNNPTTDSCAKTTFTAVTSAPGGPTDISAVDGSNRDSMQYKVFLTWTAPAQQGTGFAGYEIYRSTDGNSYSAIGTTSGTTYADTGLSSTKYYYYAKSKDNANQFSVASTAVNITPTGRYTAAPSLSKNPSHTIKAYSVLVGWMTDRESSSFIEYGTDQNQLGEQNGGKTVGKLDSVTDHTVSVEGLQPETQYYYRGVWVDSDGNRAQSQRYNFITDKRPSINSVKVFNITLNSATISYSTTSSTNTTINYGKTTAYGNSITESSGSQTTNHSVQISDLDHSSTYHLQVTGADIDGNTLVSDDYIFDTLPMPKIESLSFEPVAGAATTNLRVTWKTNVETSSVISYAMAGESKELQKSEANFTTDHELIIDNLSDQSTYVFKARGFDRFSNEAVSDSSSFVTPVDTRPPSISDVVTETSNVGLDNQDKAQIVVSWKTDEPATSYVEYDTGLTGGEYTLKTSEDGTMTNSHLVIISDLDPNKPYHLRVGSVDKGRNTTKSDDITIIAGNVPKSILNILMDTFDNLFGWMGKLV